MRYRVLKTACLLALTACDPVYNAQDAAELKTITLCQMYNGPVNKNYGSQIVKAELEKRGKTRCIEPAVAEHNRNRQIVTGLFGPLGAGVHAIVSPEPSSTTEGSPERNQTVDNEIAQIRREQAERQRRDLIASMVAQGASDEDIRKALSSTLPPPN